MNINVEVLLSDSHSRSSKESIPSISVQEPLDDVFSGNVVEWPNPLGVQDKLLHRFVDIFIYQLFWTQVSPEVMCTNGTQVPCEVPPLPNPTTRKGWPHHRGIRPLLFSNSVVGSFTSHKNKSGKVLWDGTYGFSSLSEKKGSTFVSVS